MSHQLLYIDPGSAGLVWQAIVGVCLGIAVFFKNIKYAILSLFGRKKKDETDPEHE